MTKYARYYRNFVPFVIDLGGAVNLDSYGALKEIMREAANAAGPRLRWEMFDWAARLCSAASRSRWRGRRRGWRRERQRACLRRTATRAWEGRVDRLPPWLRSAAAAEIVCVPWCVPSAFV